ncbi:MAG: hypothetical protein KBT29_06420 [Prevotellaceae bacterium]|nr:hypothetical protein [Candidatus Minthosoma caballi]
MFKFLASLFVASLSLTSVINDADRISFGFSTGSLAPEYQYSYSVVVVPEKVTISFTKGYGDSNAKDSMTITKQQFENIKEHLKKQNVKKVKEVNEGICGASTNSLVVYKGKECVFNAYRMGSDGNLNMDGSLLSSVENCIPGFKEKFRATKESLKIE